MENSWAFGGWWGHIRNNNNYTLHHNRICCYYPHHRTPLRHSSGSQPLLVFICFGGAESARLRSRLCWRKLNLHGFRLCESFNCTKQDIKRSREEFSHRELVVGADIESSFAPVLGCTMQADYSETLIAFANLSGGNNASVSDSGKAVSSTYRRGSDRSKLSGENITWYRRWAEKKKRQQQHRRVNK